MFEVITTGRVSVWGEDRNRRGGGDDLSCRHLVGARGNYFPKRFLFNPALCLLPDLLHLSLPSIFTHLQFLLQTLVGVFDREADNVQFLCHTQQTLGQPKTQ